MADLFSWQVGAESGKVGAMSGRPDSISDYSSRGGRGTRLPRAKPGQAEAARTAAPTTTGRASRGGVSRDETRRNLRAEANQIHLDLAQALRMDGELDAALAPFANAAKAAEEALRDLINEHGPGPRACAVTRDTILAAYTAHMLARQAAHPHRQRLDDARRWAKRLRVRLREIKDELDD